MKKTEINLKNWFNICFRAGRQSAFREILVALKHTRSLNVELTGIEIENIIAECEIYSKDIIWDHEKNDAS